MRQFIMLYFSTNRFVFFFISLMVILSKDANAQSTVLKGVTIDGQSNLPLPYVSIGIKNKPIGTVSDSTGRYSLSYLQTDIAGTDSIFFSAVGYKSVKLDWDLFLKTEKFIKLYESPLTLAMVNIKANPGQIKKYGRSNASLIFFPTMYKIYQNIAMRKGASRLRS